MMKFMHGSSEVEVHEVSTGNHDVYRDGKFVARITLRSDRRYHVWAKRFSVLHNAVDYVLTGGVHQ